MEVVVVAIDVVVVVVVISNIMLITTVLLVYILHKNILNAWIQKMLTHTLVKLEINCNWYYLEIKSLFICEAKEFIL